MSTLPLDDIVNVSINIGASTTIRTNFNVALIVGNSSIIKPEERVKTYSKISEMISDGWKGNEPEFLAAQIYFSQVPKPIKVAIGLWDKKSGETAVQAISACRICNSEWYTGYVCELSKDETIEVAKFIESASPSSTFAYSTSDSEVQENKKGNLVEQLKELSLRRTIGQYSTINHSIIAAIGFAMGANTQTANSAYTLKFKEEIGIKPEALSSTQKTSLKMNNCNVYVNRGSVYNLFEDGVMADGTPFDEILNSDILTNNIQLSVINALQSNSKISQTDPGMDNLLNYITAPLEKARSIGFIAPGVWKGQPILSVKKGDVLPRGYLVLSDSIDSQSQADREARKSPPIYVLAKLAGSLEGISISVNVGK